MDCFDKDSCANFGVKCHECWSMADIYNHHPCYLKKPVKIRLGSVERVRLICGTDPSFVECEVNEFIKDKDVVDILYQSVSIARPPYVSDRVMIIYKEENRDV